MQRAAFWSLYGKYRDDINPYNESKELVPEKYTRLHVQGYVFLVDDEPAGAVRISLSPDGESARVSALCVLPRFQGQGIAQRVLLQIEEYHQDVKRWQLDTIMQEEGNCHLYEKLGYQRSGHVEGINEKMTLVFYDKQK